VDPVKSATPSFAETKSARERVGSSPYDLDALRKLMKIEEARGQSAMVEYLRSRIESAQSEEKDDV